MAAVRTSFRNGALAGFLCWQVAALQAALLNQLGGAPLRIVILAVPPGILAAFLGGVLGVVAALLVPRPRRSLAAAAPAVLLLLSALGRNLLTGAFADRKDLLLGPTVQAFSLGLVAVGLLVVFLLLRRGPVAATLLAAATVLAAGTLLSRPDRGHPLTREEADALLTPVLPPRPVLLLALPGLPPALLEAELAADRTRTEAERRLPNLAILRTRGLQAPLAPFRPPGGAVHWTTLATGARWMEHGVHGESFRTLPGLGPLDLQGALVEGLPERLLPAAADFLHQPALLPSPPRPADPGQRTRPPFWEVLGRSRHAPLVLSWPLAFPPGGSATVVLEDGAFAAEDPGTHIAPTELGVLELTGLVRSLAAPERQAEARAEGRRFLASLLPSPGLDGPAGEALVEALVRFQARRELAFILLEELAREPARPPAAILVEPLAADWARVPAAPPLAELLPLLDLTLGNLLVRLEGEPLVLLLLPGTGAGDPGLVVAAGPPFRSGARLPALRPEDLAPTLLHALGLPAAGDCSGRPVEAWFRPDFLREHPVRLAPSWQLRSVAP